MPAAAGAAAAAGASDFAAGLGADLSPQPARPRAAASSVDAILELFMEFSGEGVSRRTGHRPAIIPRSPATDQPRRDRSARSKRLFLRQNPLHQGLDVLVGHRGVRRHRDLAPDAHAALLHLLEELRFGGLVAGVLGRDLFIGRADDLLVHGVAREAVVLLRELFACLGGVAGRDGGARDGQDCELLHAFSLFCGGYLRIFFKSTRSAMGGRKVTPRHSQPLTGSAPAGFSSGSGSPFVPSGIASRVVSGRYSRASAARHSASGAALPRKTTTLCCSRDA